MSEARGLQNADPTAERWIDRWWLAIPLLVVVGAWQVMAGRKIGATELPGPVDTIVEFGRTVRELLAGDPIVSALAITAAEVILGLVIALATAILFGWLAGTTATGRRMLSPYLTGLLVLPLIAIAPLVTVWAGPGFNSKVALAALLAVWPIARHAANAYHEEPAEAGRGRNIAARTLYGTRLAVVWALTGTVVGEFLGGGEGLAESLRLNAQALRLERAIALAVWILALGVVVYGLVWMAERLVSAKRSAPTE